MAQLRSKGKFENRLLVLAGPNNPALAGANEVYETVEQLDLASTVRFLGHAPDEHLPGLYAGASVLAMPSLYEGFGFPVLESMAVGTPVVILMQHHPMFNCFIPPGERHRVVAAKTIEAITTDMAYVAARAAFTTERASSLFST